MLIPTVLMTQGCLSIGAFEYARDDPRVAASQHEIAVAADGRPVLALRTFIGSEAGDFSLAGRADRWVRLDLEQQDQQPASHRVVELEGLTVEEAENQVRKLPLVRQRHLFATATRLRDEVRAVRKNPLQNSPDDKAKQRRAGGRLVRIGGGFQILLLHRVGELEPYDEVDAALASPASPEELREPQVVKVAIILPHTFETTPGDKVARATTGAVMIPFGIVGDAAIVSAVVVGGAVAVVASPFLGAYAIADEIMR